MSEAVAIAERQKRATGLEFTRPPESLWRDAWRRLLRNRAAVVSGIFLIMGIVFAILMINAKSALDVWWTISGIFGGGILGLFLIALLRLKIGTWQGIVSIVASVIAISWATFARNLPQQWKWLECNIETIIIGAFGTALMLIVIISLSYLFPATERLEIEK